MKIAIPSLWQEQQEWIDKNILTVCNVTSRIQSFKKSKLASPNCSNQLWWNPLIKTAL